MEQRKYPFCRYCGRTVRLRKDGCASRHKGINRFRQKSARCIGSLYPVTIAAQRRET